MVLMNMVILLVCNSLVYNNLVCIADCVSLIIWLYILYWLNIPDKHPGLFGYNNHLSNVGDYILPTEPEPVAEPVLTSGWTEPVVLTICWASFK